MDMFTKQIISRNVTSYPAILFHVDPFAQLNLERGTLYNMIRNYMYIQHTIIRFCI